MEKIIKDLLLLIFIVHFVFNNAVAGLSNNEENYSALRYQHGEYYYDIDSNGDARLTYYDGENIENLVLPTELDGHTLTEIGSGAFDKTHNIKYITIPGTVKTIYEEAFYQCYDLEIVTIEEGVSTIDIAAFCECSSLLSVSIPSSVVYMKGNPFFSCESLKEILVSEANPALSVYDQVLFNKSEKKLITFPDGLNFDVYSVPAGTESIGEQAFSFNNRLTSVILPNSVKVIEDRAFNGCSLSEIIIPDSVVMIGKYAFDECYYLTSVKMSKNITFIDDDAFYICPELKTIILPDTLHYVGEDAFDSEIIVLNVYRGSWAENYARNNEFEFEYIQ